MLATKTMTMSRKRRKHLARFGVVTSRPKDYGPSRREVRDRVLAIADGKCEWCGRAATQAIARSKHADMKSASQLAAWCGFCEPDPSKIGWIGGTSRFATFPTEPCNASNTPIEIRDAPEILCVNRKCRAKWFIAEIVDGKIPEHLEIS